MLNDQQHIRKRSPEAFPRRLSTDPFGDNYSDSEKGDDDDNGSIVSDLERRNGGLRREVGFFGCLSLVVGVMIGSGIFASPFVVFSKAHSAGMSLLVWVGSGVLCICASLCYAELGTAIKSSGGEKTYLSRAFGPLAGFLYSWTAILIVKPASLAGVSMAFSAYVCEPFYRGEADPPSYLLKCISAGGVGEFRFTFILFTLFLQIRNTAGSLFLLFFVSTIMCANQPCLAGGWENEMTI